LHKQTEPTNFAALSLFAVPIRQNLLALRSSGSNVRQHSHKAMRLRAFLRASLTPRRVSY
jgi:hypothetical protein